MFRISKSASDNGISGAMSDALAAAASTPLPASGRPLSGRAVALVHPAWHSCGTYRVVLGQIEAYRALGAEVFAVAVATDPGFVPDRAWIWKGFREATPELEPHRWFAGAPFSSVLGPRFLKDVLWPYIHGDQAVIRTGLSERAALPKALAARRFDLVHCNHFFLMPVATRLAKGAPILMDSHDIQARQFCIINETLPWLRPRATYEQMLAQELAQMRKADLLLHLNAEEDAEFRALLPEKAHALLYPATPEAPTGPGGPDIVLIASNNTANVDSVLWFLREVAPLAAGVDVKIVGNVDGAVRARAPELFESYKGWFLGRVPDPAAVYAGAKLVLLPTIAGTGLSIKTVEALSSGLPILATPQALRGMGAAALEIPGVRIAATAEDFAQALVDLAGAPTPTPAERQGSGARRHFEAHLSQQAYGRRLAELTAPLLASRDNA